MILSDRDHSDLKKFLKYFVYKFFHVLLQSRSAKKINDRSKLIASGSDWFNLLIRDESSLQAEVKKVYSQLGGLQVGAEPISIEFSLKVKADQKKESSPKENKLVLLETWSIRMESDLDTSIKVSFGVYNRLSTLLKSLVVVSRTLPFYQVRSSAGHLQFSHEVVLGETKMRGGVEFEVGRVGTPMGTVVVSSFTNAHAIQNLKKAIESSSSVTDCMFLDHFSNDFYEFGQHSEKNDGEAEDGGDIVSVTKDDKGNVIIKNYQEDVDALKVHNDNVRKSENIRVIKDIFNNNNIIQNDNSKHNINIKQNNNQTRNLSKDEDKRIKNNGIRENKNEFQEKSCGNGDNDDDVCRCGEDEKGEEGRKREMVGYDDFEDVGLAEFYKELKKAEEMNIFTSQNNNNTSDQNNYIFCNNKANNKSFKKFLYADDDDEDDDDVKKKDSLNPDADFCSLSNTLAEFEANAINFDAFVQSIDNVLMIE